MCVTESLCYTAEINNIVNQQYFKKLKKNMHFILKDEVVSKILYSVNTQIFFFNILSWTV